MINVKAEELVNPVPLFKLCMLSKKKLHILVDKLRNEKLYLPDCLRTDTEIYKIIYHNFGWDDTLPLCLPYEIGDFDGVIVFQDIAKDDQCGMMMKFWGKSLWGAKLARQARKLINLIMEKFNLNSVHIYTADRKAVKLGKLFGFELKEIYKDNFQWDGVSYDKFLLEKGV